MRSWMSLFFCLLCLYGCQYNNNQHIIFNPEITQKITQTLPVAINFSIIDKRKQPILMVVIDGDAQETHYPAQRSEITIVKELFIQQFQNNHVVLSPDAAFRWTIEIHQLDSEVIQTRINYLAKQKIAFKVIAKTNTKTFSQVFYGESKIKAPFSFEMARIERELNTLTTKIISDILTHDEFNYFIKEYYATAHHL